MPKLHYSGFPYVVCILAIWAAGGIAVPLCTSHPTPEQIYTLEDSQASILLSHPVFEERTKELISKTKVKCINKDDESYMYKGDSVPTLFESDFHAGALIIYTSGTTGKPKGAVSTHAIIHAQASVLVTSWYWSSTDRIHHILPLHHIHGIVNALITPLLIGATVEMHQKFVAEQVWERWSNVDLPPLTVFMSVPTVYSKLYQHYKKVDKETRIVFTKGCQQFRFMVSGSASLPTTLRNYWRKASGGQVLLERYGMTEIGMALSQEYVIWERVQGTVGIPLPGVQVRIIAEDGKDVTDKRNTPGMLQIKGNTVFKEYWQRPEATKKEFTKDGWFQTGDVSQRLGHHGYYQIMGRNSIDIIKTGGEKVSALEIERELLSLNLGIQDVAVVGISDPEWGQKVAAVVVMDDGKELDLLTIRNNLKKQLAVYKVPSLLKVVSELPKNAMGKVTKKDLVCLF
ncbi:uncharacterized protein EV154DRAFT_220851 [Mucor mucedo]|uniref:uncharacterized protein n=1 Tax=Mucor mucedo TaxID=29922 RepID=UPI00221F3ED5|nr:uncharacterized protein EV154DRAFT_220851 [Mucor mucedo]KAI7891526.1 hypothetical protein EV154DRAFT_220851 [Mucor mucedo]